MSAGACIIWFVVLSFGGWIFETVYCTVVNRRWQNRGFLYGPVCPIYGVGGLAAMVTYQQLVGTGADIAWWHIFLFTCFGSMPLEYATHWTLEKLFGAYWWDYSNMPINLNGRICLPASLLFGAGGVLCVYVLHPALSTLTGWLPDFAVMLVSYVLVASLAADATLTVVSLTRFAHIAARVEEAVDVRMEKLVSSALETGRNIGEERERIAELTRREQIAELGHIAGGAVRRVKGFRPSPIRSGKSQLEALRKLLKEAGTQVETEENPDGELLNKLS